MLWRYSLVCCSEFDTGLKGIHPHLISRILVITAEQTSGPARLPCIRILSTCMLGALWMYKLSKV